MRKIFQLSCFILFVLALSINGFAQKLDKDFAVEAAQYRAFELEAARLAIKNAQNQKIKEYAEKVRRDYTKFDGQLKQIAESKSLKLSVKEMSEDQIKILTDLQSAKGKAFDDMYIKTVGVELNQNQKELYEKQIENGEDKEYKEYARTILPSIDAHLSAAQQLNSNLPATTSNTPTTGSGITETPSPNSTPTPPGGGDAEWSLTDSLLLALAFIWAAVPYLLSLGTLGTMLFFYFWKIKPSFEALDKEVKLKANASDVRKNTTDQKENYEKLDKRFRKFVEYVNDLSQERFTYSKDGAPPAVAPAASNYKDDYTPPPPKRIEFPATVKDLHDFIHSESPIVRDDIANNVMVNDAGGNFYVLHDTSTGKDYLVPRSERFQTADDYYTHFAKFYDGDVSFGGSIKIDTPTVVRYTDNGWEISGKGRLHVE